MGDPYRDEDPATKQIREHEARISATEQAVQQLQRSVVVVSSDVSLLRTRLAGLSIVAWSTMLAGGLVAVLLLLLDNDLFNRIGQLSQQRAPSSEELEQRRAITRHQDHALCARTCIDHWAPSATEPPPITETVSADCWWESGGRRVCSCSCHVYQVNGAPYITPITVAESR